MKEICRLIVTLRESDDVLRDVSSLYEIAHFARAISPHYSEMISSTILGIDNNAMRELESIV